MLRKSSLWVLLVILASSLVSARIELITVAVEGEGSTFEEAVTSALAMAVSQVHGMELKATTEGRTSAQAFISEEVVSDEFLIEIQRWAQTSTRGMISGFEVIEHNRIGDRYWAHVRVDLPRIQNSPSAQRIRAAVSGFRSDEGRVEPEWIRLFEDRVSMYLTQTRRFAVLDRSSSSAIAAERDRIRSADTAPEERVRLGREIAADLLLTGHLERFELRKESFTFQSGREVSRFHPEALVSLRVVDLATGEVRFARQIGTALEGLSSGDDSWALSLANSLAHKAARSVLDAVFPVTIVHAEAGSVYLNTGGDVLTVGDLLDVFALEGQLTDPYTGERLGPIERLVGRIEVTTVSDKISVATVLEAISDIAPYAICRPTGSKADANAVAEPDQLEFLRSSGPNKTRFDDDNW
ncbi:MAG: hypothetical protein JJT96_11315 [Opitutales bacterium]|nr:hypothetical protein [Opitutales bacterium]